MSEVLAEREADPRKAAALARARKRLAGSVQAKGPETLSALRLRRGLSQTQLARQIGTSQSRLSRIEAGLDDIMLSTANRLAEALDVTLDRLNHAIENTRN